MPGPGGGSHGGGGHRGGGSFGGSRGGMSHGGRMHGGRPHGGVYRGGWYHRPMFFGGGGCLSGLFSMFLLPIFLIFFVFMIFSSSLSMAFSDISTGGTVKYDENKFQDYADTQYKAEFGSSTAYEDNILLLFLVDDRNYYDYYYIAWVGDHVDTSINYVFGNENTKLGQAITSAVNTTSYKYSLDSNLAQVIETMKNEITSKNLESSFTCDENHNQVTSHLTNKTNLELTESTINSALESFTNETGISFVVVVEDITDVFTKRASTSSIIMVIILIALIVFMAYSIIKNMRNRKENNYSNKNNNYYDCNDWEEK